MNKIKCIIIDEDSEVIQLIAKYCTMTDQLEVVGTFFDTIDVFEAMKTLKLDLIFLNIQETDVESKAFLKSLKSPPSVIITTDDRDYKAQSYDVEIIDYLIKPISIDRFLKSIDRYRSTFPDEVALSSSNQNNEFIFFDINQTHRKVAINKIQYLEANKDHVRVHTKGDQLVVKGDIESILSQIPEGKLIRIHRSYAIALHALKAYNQKSVMINGLTLPIGESYRDEFNKHL